MLKYSTKTYKVERFFFENSALASKTPGQRHASGKNNSKNGLCRENTSTNGAYQLVLPAEFRKISKIPLDSDLLPFAACF